MADEKSILETLEDKAKGLAKKVEEVLDEISADEEPTKVTYPEDDKAPQSPTK